MSIKVKIPEIYDNFRSEYVIPVQCFAEPPIDTALGFRVLCDDAIMEYPKFTVRCLGEGTFFKIPVSEPVEHDPSKKTVVLEYYKGTVTEEATQRQVRFSGSSWIPLGQPTTQDSIFVRMALDATYAIEDARQSKAFSRFVKIKDEVFGLESAEAARVSDAILKYLSEYDVVEPKIRDGLVYTSTVLDAIEAKKANVFMLGLLFCNISYHLGLDPIMAIVGDRCITGVKVSIVDVEKSEFTGLGKNVNFPDPDLYAPESCDGFYLLFDMSETSSALASIESAAELLKGRKADVKVSVKYEIQKNETLKTLYCRK